MSKINYNPIGICSINQCFTQDVAWGEKIVADCYDGTYIIEKFCVEPDIFYIEIARDELSSSLNAYPKESEAVYNELKAFFLSTRDFFFQFFKEKYEGNKNLYDLFYGCYTFYIQNKSIKTKKQLIVLKAGHIEFFDDYKDEKGDFIVCIDIDRKDFNSIKRALEDAISKAYSIVEAFPLRTTM